MTLSSQEFMRRFLLHVLPGGFHRIRHYGLLANGSRRADLARVREALHVVAALAVMAIDSVDSPPSRSPPPAFVCRHCGHTLILVQTFMRGQAICAPPTP
jgi:Putative transposase